MGHILQKYFFGYGCLLCCAQSFLQKFLLFQLILGGFFLLLFPVDKIGNDQYDQDCQQSDKKPDMILDNIRQCISHNRIKITVRVIKPITFSQNTESMVQDLKQCLISGSDSETEFFAV